MQYCLFSTHPYALSLSKGHELAAGGSTSSPRTVKRTVLGQQSNTNKLIGAIATAMFVMLLSPAAFAAKGNITTDRLKSRFADDSPENIKVRSALGDPVAGRDKSLLCQGCHGEKGMSVEGMIPHLAGQYDVYISKNLRNFQSGARTHQIMSAMAATIDDADLADISAYFAAQPKMKGTGSKSNSEIGRNIFLKGDMARRIIACVHCHGVDGKGKTASNPVFPVIGGQQADYLRGQLINWRKSERVNSPGGIMNKIAQKLTDQEIDSLAEYLSGL